MKGDFTILIVDDQPLQSEAYKGIFELLETDYTLHFEECYNCKEAFEFATQRFSSEKIDLILLDYSLPPFQEEGLYSGRDLALLFRKHIPQAKIIFITSHHEAFLLYDLYQEFNPAGILVKSDFDGLMLEQHFFDALNNIETYSNTFLEAKMKIITSEIFLESNNRKIISLLAQGHPSKDLPTMIDLSMNAIDKRKARLKVYFKTEKSSDNYLVLEARKQGLI